MKHEYDWSKLDAGWRLCDAHTGDEAITDGGIAWSVSYLEDIESGMIASAKAKEASAQLAKCRIENASDHVVRVTVDALNQWSIDNTVLAEAPTNPYPNGLRCKSCGADRPHKCPGPQGCWQGEASEFVKPRLVCDHDWEGTLCLKCGVQFFDLSDSEQERIVPTPSDDIADRMPAFAPSNVIATLSNKPPWRRGPLAIWTLVNISCHDGRLTVVMRRGRGEVVIETGVDDEAIWERLALKVVDIDKAKEKSDV